MIGDYMAATKCPDPCVMSWNGNTTETKTDIAKFISFRFKFFRFRFVSVFRNFFVSVFVSVNGINFFPLTDISVSVSVNVNHTAIVTYKNVKKNQAEVRNEINNSTVYLYMQRTSIYSQFTRLTSENQINSRLNHDWKHVSTSDYIQGSHSNDRSKFLNCSWPKFITFLATVLWQNSWLIIANMVQSMPYLLLTLRLMCALILLTMSITLFTQLTCPLLVAFWLNNVAAL